MSRPLSGCTLTIRRQRPLFVHRQPRNSSRCWFTVSTAMSACSAAKFSPGSVGTWYMVVIRVGSGSSSGPGSPTEGYPMLTAWARRRVVSALIPISLLAASCDPCGRSRTSAWV